MRGVFIWHAPGVRESLVVYCGPHDGPYSARLFGDLDHIRKRLVYDSRDMVSRSIAGLWVGTAGLGVSSVDSSYLLGVLPS